MRFCVKKTDPLDVSFTSAATTSMSGAARMRPMTATETFSALRHSSLQIFGSEDAAPAPAANGSPLVRSSSIEVKSGLYSLVDVPMGCTENSDASHVRAVPPFGGFSKPL